MPHKAPQLAKLTRPRVHNAVARQRLFTRLDQESEQRPAICIVGPPGAGKTTLTASWLDARKRPGIWYQVDAGDAELATFFYYLRQGGGGFTRKGKRPLPLLTPEYLPDVAGFSRRFFRELFARLPDEAVLVLDNYQEVPADQQWHRLVADAVTEVREGVTIAIISRRDPPDCYARLRANETVAFLEWDDLKLDLDEATAIARARNVNDAKIVRALHTRSDGWAAGMILMLERVRRGQAAAAPDKVDAGAASAYFASQILDEVNQRERGILMRAALFSTVTTEMASQLSGEPDAGELLELLYRQQLFTDRRAGPPDQYQFHALFREFLLQQFEQKESAATCRELKVRAAAVLESHGRAEEAIPLFRVGGDDASAARLILQLAPQVLSQGRWRPLQEWIRALPEERVRDNPWLLYWLGMAQMQQQSFADARELLSRAFERQGAAANAVGQLLAAAAVLRTYHFEFNNFQPMEPWIDRVDELMEQLPCFPSPETELDVYGALLAAFQRRRPGHPRLQHVVERVTSLLEADVDANLKTMAAAPLVIFYTIVPDVGRAQAIVERLEPTLRCPELTALNRAFWWITVGLHHFRRGQREAADQALDEADRVSIEHGIERPQFLSRIYRAYNRAILWSDLEGALSALEGLEQYLSPSRPMNAAQYHQAWHRVELLRGDANEAKRHALLGLDAVSKLGGAFFSMQWKITAAASLALDDEHEECERLLALAWSEADGTFLSSYRVNILLVRAYSALKCSKREEAHARIREMLALGRCCDSWRSLQPEFPLREIVLEEAISAGIETELVRTIIRSFGLKPRRTDIEEWPWPVRVHTLGRFEVLVDDKPIEPSRKSPRRPLALLKALIAFGSVDVPKAKLVDALWPQEEGDAAQRDFDVALYRLRKLLSNSRAIVFEDGRLSIDTATCWVDVLEIQKRLDQLDQGLKRPDENQLEISLNAISRLYGGIFLPAEMDAAWSVSMRERLRDRFVHAVQRGARRFEAAGRWHEAIEWYGKGLRVDDLAESLYQGLMRCYLQTGQRAEGLTCYRRLQDCLAAGLSISPNTSSEALRRQLEAG